MAVRRMLASDLYRLVRGRMLWGFLAALALVLAAAIAFFWWGTSGQFADAARSQAAQEQVVGLSSSDEGTLLGVGASTGSPYHEDDAARVMQSHTYAYAGLLISGGFLPLFVSIVAVVLSCEDYETGFAKSLSCAGPRLARMGARLVLVTALVLAFYAVGVAVCELGLPLAGFTYASADEPLRYLAYTGLALLSTLCYALLSLLVAELTRSKVAGIALASLVSTGMLGSALSAVLAQASLAVPALADALTWLPSYALRLLTGGADALFAAGEVAGLPAPEHAALALAAATLAAGALALVAGARRDVA